MFGMTLNLSLNSSNKQGKFSKALPIKGFEFILSVGGGTIVFKLSFMLLLPKVVSILEK